MIFALTCDVFGLAGQQPTPLLLSAELALPLGEEMAASEEETTPDEASRENRAASDSSGQRWEWNATESEASKVQDHVEANASPELAPGTALALECYPRPWLVSLDRVSFETPSQSLS